LEVSVSVPDEEGCATMLRRLRWGEGPVKCVHCGSRKVNRDGNSRAFRKYWCRACGSYFNDKSKTIFQDSKVPLSKWFTVSLLLQSEKSVVQISREVGVSYRNTYYIAKKLRGSHYSERIAGILGSEGHGPVPSSYPGESGKSSGGARRTLTRPISPIL
jgi:transposase-like protein